MSAKLATLGVLAAGLLGFGAWSFASTKKADPAPADNLPQPQPVPEATPQPLQGEVAEQEQPPPIAERDDVLVLPDGSTVPLLNNCRGKVDMARGWGDHPWSPIVAREVDPHGWEWYLHEDGTYSQTKMIFRKDLNKWEPLLQVARKAAVAPIAPEDLEIAERERKARDGIK
jgi:hypothetical protein